MDWKINNANEMLILTKFFNQNVGKILILFSEYLQCECYKYSIHVII